MSIGRNAMSNVIGFLVPTAIGLAVVPAYLHLIGPERYGILALVWLILGYFGLFDLGLGRATSQRIAALRDATSQERQRALATGLVTNLIVGGIGSAVLYPVAWYIFGHGISLAPAMRAETMRALPLLALALPIATVLGLLSGALVGREQFRTSNRISITSTSLFQLLPLAVAWAYGPDLLQLMVASIGARLIGVAMLWQACRREFGSFGLAGWEPAEMRRLLAFGGWVTFSGLFSPLLVFTDRFAIGALIGAAMVTVYTVPMDAMRRIAGLSVAIANALFPRLAVAGEEETQGLARMATGAYYLLLTPPVAGMLVIMDPVMRLWLGDSLGAEAAPLARLFLIATWANSFAQIPYLRLLAQGRPDLISKILITEVPFYLFGLWLGLAQFGLIGAAWAYLVRILIDTILMFRFGLRAMPYWPLMLVTTLSLAALSTWLDWMGKMEWSYALPLGVLAAAAAMPASVLIAPEGLRRTARELASQVRDKFQARQ